MKESTAQKIYEITNTESIWNYMQIITSGFINVNKLMKNSTRVTNINKLYFNIAENFASLIFPLTIPVIEYHTWAI